MTQRARQAKKTGICDIWQCLSSSKPALKHIRDETSCIKQVTEHKEERSIRTRYTMKFGPLFKMASAHQQAAWQPVASWQTLDTGQKLQATYQRGHQHFQRPDRYERWPWQPPRG